jgi:CRP/FNR family transcriptional regulator, cyclic AMP receptor protein
VARRGELVEHLAAVPLFSQCTKRERQIVARHAEIVELDAGTEMTVEGQPGDSFFVVLEGEATVHRGGVEVRNLGPGTWFGELALLDPGPRSATVVATTPVRTAVLGARMFRIILRELPAISERLLAALARQIKDTESSPSR